MSIYDQFNGINGLHHPYGGGVGGPYQNSLDHALYQEHMRQQYAAQNQFAAALPPPEPEFNKTLLLLEE